MCVICRVGQNHICIWCINGISGRELLGQNHMYMVHKRHVWQGNHQIYGHVRCIYRVGQNRICTPYMTVCM